MTLNTPGCARLLYSSSVEPYVLASVRNVLIVNNYCALFGIEKNLIVYCSAQHRKFLLYRLFVFEDYRKA